jgi:heme exporter protein C
MRISWWKILTIFLLAYAFTAGLLIKVPDLPELGETSRNLFFHVGMWAAMVTLFTVSMVNSILYLRKLDLKYDIHARQYAVVGLVFGLLGYATGTIWMRFTWADPNNPGYSFSTIAREPKLIGTAIAMLIYCAYMVLRNSINDMDKRARVSAVYNIFAFAMLIPAIYIIPNQLPSLHPGQQEGSPALNFKDASAAMRMVEYPAFIGWALLGVWITTLTIRISKLKDRKLSQ